MKVYIGSDHAGYKLKQSVKEHLEAKGYDLVDLGSFSGEEAVDYPDIAREVSEKVFEYPDSLGIMVCGTGQGSAMACNRHKGIRAALCHTTELAKLSREHNHANVLCLGERTTDKELALQIVDTFFDTPVSGEERHKKRVEKFDE